jgi:hypothetical protein
MYLQDWLLTTSNCGTAQQTIKEEFLTQILAIINAALQNPNLLCCKEHSNDISLIGMHSIHVSATIPVVQVDLGSVEIIATTDFYKWDIYIFTENSSVNQALKQSGNSFEPFLILNESPSVNNALDESDSSHQFLNLDFEDYRASWMFKPYRIDKEKFIGKEKFGFFIRLNSDEELASFIANLKN